MEDKAVALAEHRGHNPRKSLGMLAEEAMIRSEWMVLGCYAVIYVVSVSLIVRGMTKRTPGFDSKLAAGQKVEDMDAETKVWRQGFLIWLSISWASPWCARWGHSLNAALTKIKADQLPQLGFRDGGGPPANHGSHQAGDRRGEGANGGQAKLCSHQKQQNHP